MGESRKSPLLIALAVGVGVLLLVVGVLTGLLLGRGQPQAATSPSAISPQASPQPSPGATTPTTSTTPADPSIATMQCAGPGLADVAAWVDGDDLAIEVTLAGKLEDGAFLEVLFDVGGDGMFDQQVTYSVDTGSSHLWDGEDEFDFLVVPSSLDGLAYRVTVPLAELGPDEVIERWSTGSTTLARAARSPAAPTRW
jgi:hypothetical protein